VIYDRGDLAAVKAKPTPALTNLSLTMNQSNHTESLPSVFARTEGTLRFRSSFV